MDKKDKQVPLLTAEQANEAFMAGAMSYDAGDALLSIASGDAATYNTNTHEVVPKGLREAVERAIARLRWDGMDRAADELQRALNGKKS